ncbi:MAG: glutaredoxin domain-containing protein, partial [Alphaproteobacteria bacterium]
MKTIEEIKNCVESNDVVLFMKGSKKMPMCGFSGTVTQILKNLGVADYKDVNILADE